MSSQFLLPTALCIGSTLLLACAESSSCRATQARQGDASERSSEHSGEGSGERPLPMSTGKTVTELPPSIWYVFQDKGNNYWFGSDGQGVFRFDGTTITQFTTQDGLGGDRIRGIQQHASGDILVSSLGEVSRFDGRRFETLPVTVMDSADEGWVLQPDDVWLTWQSGQLGPYRYDGKTLYHLKFPKHTREDEYNASRPNRSWSPYEVYCVYKDRRGHMWFGTVQFGICRFDGEHLDWMYEQQLTETPAGGWFGIRSIIEDRAGDFWFCNTQYRYKVEPHGAPSQREGQVAYTRAKGVDVSGSAAEGPYFFFMSIVDDERGDLWMATYSDGVWRYDGKSLTHYPVVDGDNGPGESASVFAISKDNRGTLWLGTHDAGAFRFNGTAFERFRP